MKELKVEGDGYLTRVQFSRSVMSDLLGLHGF